MKKARILPFLLSLFLIAGLLAGCNAGNANGGGTASPTPSAAASSTIAVTPTEPFKDRRTTRAKSYDDAFKALKAAAELRVESGRNDVFSVTGKGTPLTMPAAAPTADIKTETAQGNSGSFGYSETNVQIKGVDEGDIVKTDGQYIYVLRQGELIVFKASGAATQKLSSMEVVAQNRGDMKPMPKTGASGAPELASYTSENATDLYVTGNTAVVVSSSYTSIPYALSDAAKAEGAAADAKMIPYENKQVAKLYIVDLSDKSKPALKTTLGQDGAVLTSRLIGDTLYLVSNYYVYNFKQTDSKSYVPSLYTGVSSIPVTAASIAIAPSVNTSSYAVVCAYDVKAGKLLSNESILGGGTTVYMTKDALYLAGSQNNQMAGTPYADSVYTVVDFTTTSVTDIVRFDVTGSGLMLAASGSVEGSLHNQFSLDAWNGNLRVVTTTYSQSWSEYTDKAKGFVNYVYKTPQSSNALWVLNADLKAVGSVGSLAPGEQVQSVRFDGAIGYICTFRQVDPLFAVDLSVPTNPVVLSALKIPGFSQYLHPYSDGRLLGLGMDADEKSGRTNGMKLTMFDTTNPKNVTVKNSLKLTSNWSTALYNHKAILISADKNIIAFPTDSGYDIYGYSDAQGFVKRAAIGSLKNWSGDSRGLYIGDNAYVVDNAAVLVLDMDAFKVITSISF